MDKNSWNISYKYIFHDPKKILLFLWVLSCATWKFYSVKYIYYLYMHIIQHNVCENYDARTAYGTSVIWGSAAHQ